MTASSGSEWDERYSQQGVRTDPAAFVVAASALFMPEGAVLDLAGGSGRNAVWLAARGWQVTLVDGSESAADLAIQSADEAEVEIQTEVRDIESHGLPDGEWDVVLIHHYLDWDVLEAVAGSLRQGGLLAFCQPTVRNLERHKRPAKRWLLDEGQLKAWIEERSDTYELVLLAEGWSAEERHEARMVARLI